MTSILLLGLLLGMRHALESDHVAAVASLASRRPSLRHAVLQGAVWGLGHTITLFLACSAVLFLDRLMPERLAQGLDAAWLENIQSFLPPADLTIFIDIAPETAVKRKAHDRDRYERDLALLGRVRSSYHRQSAQPNWVRIDGERPKDQIADDVFAAVTTRLSR